MRLEHIPRGNPCAICGMGDGAHRVEHEPQGDPCVTCGLPPTSHRVRPSRKRNPEYTARKREKTHNQPVTFLGIDGEGVGRVNHKYVYLACSDETGERKWSVENEDGLSTIACLDFILALPIHNHKLFAYSFGYDLTKILADLPDRLLYSLYRAELRSRHGKDAIKGPRPIRWQGYFINLVGGKFVLQKSGRRVVLWDIFKFYQSKFVGALEDWKVGTEKARAEMTHMKDKRADFDKMWADDPDAVRLYCLNECRDMAELAHKLVDAHEAVGLKLRSYYGAGSSAAAMLSVMGIKDQLTPAPRAMNIALASAFFGGRFENSVIGSIKGLVYNYDISSAYPYQQCFLPCLLHGKWKRTGKRKDIEKATAALVHYGLSRVSPKDYSWGPFPFRTQDGSICFPVSSGGGWVWRDEYLQGESLFPNVQFREAWVYNTPCDCQPFKDIPPYYLERLRIGKEGPGIVLKLGMNSCYGKLAQSVGNAVFNSWIWAGMITSGCRAQILQLLGMHKDRSNLLMVATDGIYTREKLNPPRPRDTGTFGAKVWDKEKKCDVYKPLGGWEEKEVPQGVFVARPGIYFPMNPTGEELKQVRGRGVGKGVVLENWNRIVEAWERYGIYKPNGDINVAEIANVSRFCGAKSSIHRSGKPGRYVYTRANGVDGKPNYGNWIVRPVELSFKPWPKRKGVNRDGVTLALRVIKQTAASRPYQRVLDREALELKAAQLEILEQPDADLSDYD